MKGNLKFKILSVFLAILIWFYVTEMQTTYATKTILEVPIVITNMDELLLKDLTLIKPDNLYTSVKVKGIKEIVRNLTKENFEVIANLDSINTEGKADISLKVNIVNASNVEIASLMPSKLQVNIEKLVEVEKPINVYFKGNKVGEYIFDVSSVNPEKVKIKGPLSVVSTIADVCVNLEINTVSEYDIVTFKSFSIIDQLGDDITSNETLIFDKTSSQIEAVALKSKIVPIETTIIGQVANGYQIKNKTVQPNQIMIIGKENDIASIDKVYTKPIEINNAKQTQAFNVEIEPQDAIKRFVSTSNINEILKEVYVSIDIGPNE